MLMVTSQKYLKDIVQSCMVEARRHCCQVIVCIVTLLHFAARCLRIAYQCAVHIGTDLLKVTTRLLQATNIAKQFHITETHDDDVLI